jgi:predicted dehydrogenase
MSESIFTVRNNNKIFFRVHADFLQYPSSRYCRVVCDNGKVDVDLINNTINWTIENEIYKESFEGFIRNDMFISEINDFIIAIENRTKPKTTLQEGIISLKMALAIKESIDTHKVITL